ncbi:MAG TPA: hypothetical protein VF743_00540, partial [Acidimicrobiales bacterium]
VRRRRPEAFGPGPAGGYAPLTFAGSGGGHAAGFTRGGVVAVVVPRLVLGLLGGTGSTDPNPARSAWGDTTVDLPDGTWIDLVTGAGWRGGARGLGELLDRFPVALLERRDV